MPPLCTEKNTNTASKKQNKAKYTLTVSSEGGSKSRLAKVPTDDGSTVNARRTDAVSDSSSAVGSATISVQLTGLEADTPYHVRASALNDAGASLATASAPAAQKAIAPPLAVPDTRLEITSGTSLRFAWGERAGFATGEVNLLTGFSLELDVGSTFI